VEPALLLDLDRSVVEEPEGSGAIAPANVLARARVSRRGVERLDDGSIPLYDLGWNAKRAPDPGDGRGDLDAESEGVHRSPRPLSQWERGLLEGL
jgi:hypothetical protein